MTIKEILWKLRINEVSWKWNDFGLRIRVLWNSNTPYILLQIGWLQVYIDLKNRKEEFTLKKGTRVIVPCGLNKNGKSNYETVTVTKDLKSKKGA